MSEWQPIETAPKDGTVIDLWIEGRDDMVDFYAPNATKVRGASKRHGRATSFCWAHKPPNAPNWYPKGGISYPLSPEVTATHWMPLPMPPNYCSAAKNDIATSPNPAPKPHHNAE